MLGRKIYVLENPPIHAWSDAAVSDAQPSSYRPRTGYLSGAISAVLAYLFLHDAVALNAIETGRLWLESAAEKVHAFAPIFGGDVLSTRKSTVELTVYANMVRTAIEQIAMDVIKGAERCIVLLQTELENRELRVS